MNRNGCSLCRASLSVVFSGTREVHTTQNSRRFVCAVSSGELHKNVSPSSACGGNRRRPLGRCCNCRHSEGRLALWMVKRAMSLTHQRMASASPAVKNAVACASSPNGENVKKENCPYQCPPFYTQTPRLIKSLFTCVSGKNTNRSTGMEYNGAVLQRHAVLQ